MAINPQIKTLDLRPPKAPNLPIAPVEYRQLYQDQLLNALRLYFNQIDNFAQPFSSNTGGAFLKFPNGAFHQDGFTTLTNAIPNSSSTADIVVASTAGFGEILPGTILIGDELIGYTGKTATSFTGITRSVYGSGGSSHAAGVYVSEAQGVASASTALAIPFDTTDTSNQVSLDPLDTTKVIFAVAGYYNIQFSVQLINCTSSIDNVTLWFRKNTSNIDYTGGVISVPSKHAGGVGAAIVSWNLVVAVNAGDNIQLMMASESGNTVAATYPPGTSPVTPASPSVILTATFVSALY
jgi:hypothetical protein